MEEALSGSALEIAIYEAMGYVPCTNVHAGEGRSYLGGRCYAFPDSPDQGGEVPLFATSIDALREVEARLIEAGWEMHIERGFKHNFVEWFRSGSNEVVASVSSPESEAFARAQADYFGLLALRALSEGNDG